MQMLIRNARHLADLAGSDDIGLGIGPEVVHTLQLGGMECHRRKAPQRRGQNGEGPSGSHGIDRFPTRTLNDHRSTREERAEQSRAECCECANEWMLAGSSFRGSVGRSVRDPDGEQGTLSVGGRGALRSSFRRQSRSSLHGDLFHCHYRVGVLSASLLDLTLPSPDSIFLIT